MIDAPAQALAALRAPPPARRLARVAVVQDAAFCFYYHTNLRLLEANGVEVVAVSALGSCHETLPRDVDAVYLGGGYPELHASELHSGRVFRGWVHELLRVGGVVYAECGVPPSIPPSPSCKTTARPSQATRFPWLPDQWAIGCVRRDLIGHGRPQFYL